MRKQLGVNHLQTDARFVVQDSVIDAGIEAMELLSKRIAILEQPDGESESQPVNRLGDDDGPE